MQRLSRQLETMAKHDALTGVLNRRGMMERLQYEAIRSKRNQSTCSLILGDIDFFKKINDTCGHDAGDLVLKELGRVFPTYTRGQDLVSRWGGEEFLLLLPDTGIQGARTLAEKIRTGIEKMELVYDGRKIAVTMSFGLARVNPGGSIEEGITEADRHLYQAKEGGRNRVRPTVN